VTSFTSPKAIPMLRDAEEVMGRIRRVPGVEYTVLVPNLRGAERALESRADELNLVMSVSETHNLANLRMPREKSFAALPTWSAMSAAARPSMSRCPAASAAPWRARCRRRSAALERALRRLRRGPRARPHHLRHHRHGAPGAGGGMVEHCSSALPDLQLTLHFHNTRGMGLANVLAAVQGGITRFDGSLGGLGGCPYAPGASGNISSEDAVHMLDAMGYDTGMDITGCWTWRGKCRHRRP
jgi:hydroxymethylglutaryl-CoA lyase